MTGKAIAVASIDGLATLECGIASIVHWFFEEFEEIRARSTALGGASWSLYALSPRIDESSPDFSATVHDIVSARCEAHGGRFEWFPVPDSSSLRSVWSLGDARRWDEMCVSLAATVRKLCAEHEQVTVIVHGIMLTALRHYLMDVPNVQVVFIAHSLGRVFADKASENRTRFEDGGFAAMAQFPQDRIGYIGPYFKDILVDGYGRQEEQLAPFINAMPDSSFRFPADIPESERRDYLATRGIPLDRKLLFSWGRCTGQKGFDALIPGYAEFLAKVTEPWHLVLLMPQEVSPPDYVALLDELLHTLPASSYTVIREFDAKVPYYLLRDEMLQIAVFSSRFEGAPLSLLEALAFGHDGLRIAWHDIPSMRQFLDEGDSFPFASLEAKDIGDALLRAASSPGRSRTVEVGTFSGNTAAGLDEVLKWWT